MTPGETALGKGWDTDLPLKLKDVMEQDGVVASATPAAEVNTRNSHLRPRETNLVREQRA